MIHPILKAYETHGAAARIAYRMFVADYCGGVVPPRVPGCDTVIRLASRIARGFTVEQAAAREYVYRWHLAIKAPGQCNATGRRSYEPRDRSPYACVSVFGTPHTIGM